jgi:dihydropteroate synthase
VYHRVNPVFKKTPALKPQIVAIINLTPDSFSDGGQWQQPDALMTYAQQLWQAGVTWWDLGAESTRPGAPLIPAEEESARLLPHLTRLRQAFPQATLSVDTRKATVAKAALDNGANWINDISGLQFDPAMLATVATYPDTGLMLMHSQGTPDVMQKNPTYPDVVADVIGFLLAQAEQARQAGVTSLVLDPGFGFGKTQAHNTALFRALPHMVDRLRPYPLLIGTSRKSFLTLGMSQPAPADRDDLTAMTTALGYQAGVTFFRVHNALAAQHQLAWLQKVYKDIHND